MLIETIHLDDFGPICKMCKFPQREPFFVGSILKLPPPQLKLYQSEVCPFVSLAAKLPRLGTFGLFLGFRQNPP
jgi:hypothetical protein